MFLIVLMYALFAATFPLAKIAMGYTQAPYFFLAIRMLLAGVGMSAYSFLFQKQPISLSKESWINLFLAGFFAIFVAFGSEFWAIQYVSSVKVNIFYSLSPFMTAFLAFLLDRESLSKRKLLGLTIGFAGMLPLSWDSGALTVSWLPTSIYDLGLLVSVTSAAYAWFIIKRLLQQGFSLIFVNGAMTLIGGILCALSHIVLSTISGAALVPAVTSWGCVLLCMLALIIISNVIGYTMYGFLLSRHSLTFVSFSGFLCPLFGLLYGYLFMHEACSMIHLASLACVFAGLLLFYWDEQINQTVS